jgi:hypothetical protein
MEVRIDCVFNKRDNQSLEAELIELRPLLAFTKLDHQGNSEIGRKIESLEFSGRHVYQESRKNMLKECRKVEYQNCQYIINPLA